MSQPERKPQSWCSQGVMGGAGLETHDRGSWRPRIRERSWVRRVDQAGATRRVAGGEVPFGWCSHLPPLVSQTHRASILHCLGRVLSLFEVSRVGRPAGSLLLCGVPLAPGSTLS